PRAPTIDAAAAEAREKGVEVIIGIGGGSAIDGAKGISLAAVNDGPVWEYTIEFRGEMREIATRPLPLVAIPTTAGTGTEVNHIAVISNPDTDQKGPLRCQEMAPKVAIVDPELTLSLPRDITASTGFDAFTHAFERFFSPELHPFVHTLAADTMQTVYDHLGKALAEPQDIEARARLSWAATEGAMCVLAPLGEAGLHIFGLPISALFDTAHGVTLAIMIPGVLEHLCEAFPERCAELAEILGEPGPKVAPEACLGATERWLREIGMEYRLGDAGATEADCARLAAAINTDRLADRYHRSMTVGEIEEFYRSRL
ncbi:MAG: iron-containing alcohol dehydrogenase, partial [Armatimonadota bacterium]